MIEPASNAAGSRRRSLKRAAWRLALLVLVMASIGVILGAGLSSLRRGQFSSITTVAVTPASGDPSAAAETLRTIAPGVLPPSSTISIDTNDVDCLLIITARDDSAAIAQSSAAAVAELYVSQEGDPTARVVSDASRATTTAENRGRNVVIGLLVGALSGAGLAFRFRPKPISGPATTIAYAPLTAGPPPVAPDTRQGLSREAEQTGLPIEWSIGWRSLDQQQQWPGRASATAVSVRDAGGFSADSLEPFAAQTHDRAPMAVVAEPAEASAEGDGQSRQLQPQPSKGNEEPAAHPAPSVVSTAGSAPASTVPPSTASQSRLDDLVAQIGFLDAEIARYRDTLETERIRHARVMSEQSMAADEALDQARRREQAEIERLRQSYRELLADRQIEFERVFSTALAEHEQILEAEHRRHAADLERERTRRDVEIEAARRRVIEESAEAMRAAVRTSRGDQEQTEGQLTELRTAVAELTERCAELERTETRQSQEINMLRRRLVVADGQGDSRIAHLEEQVSIAEQRLEAERARSAATLSELLARSAAIAAEVDASREENKAIRAAADEAIAAYQQRARVEYEALVEAADEQTRIALAREADLEAKIADL